METFILQWRLSAKKNKKKNLQMSLFLSKMFATPPPQRIEQNRMLCTHCLSCPKFFI